ncbi:MAG: type II secretion system F family protein [Agathobacter rectalis]
MKGLIIWITADIPCSIKDWGIVFIKSMAATVIIAYLFYDSPIVVIAFPAVFAYCAKLCRQEGVRRQKEKLNEEFMNVLKVLSSNMLAGYSVENAWQEAEKEMELMYGNDSLMLSEIQEMNRQIKMNQTFERCCQNLLMKRSGGYSQFF